MCFLNRVWVRVSVACFTEIKAHNTKDDQSQADEFEGGGRFMEMQDPDYGH